MDNTLQGLTASSLGAKGSAFLTGTGNWTSAEGWVAFRSAATGVVLASITAPNISGVNYLVGKSLIDPYEFLGSFNAVRLTTGAIQAFY